MAADPQPSDHDFIMAISDALALAPPGDLARLRRMDPAGPGEGAFWALSVKIGFPGSEGWMRLVRMMALMTAKGDPYRLRKPRPHNVGRHLGSALAEADYPETRLLRFLQVSLDQRPEALERMALWLAAKDQNRGIDCRDLLNLLYRDSVEDRRRLAEKFYKNFQSQSPSKGDAA